jgi:hypothetical protein
MADGTEKPVETIQVGDYVLGHTLEPQRVTGAMEKFLLDDSFFGFSPGGPYFFTDSHLLAGPGLSVNGDGVQLWTVSPERLLNENPLMEFLSVQPITGGTELLQYNESERHLHEKEVKVFKDPVSYKRDVMVYAIQVEGDHGTYIANSFVCRHETPPFQHWPNTADLLLRVGSLPQVQNLRDLEYTLESVAMIETWVQDVDNEVRNVISSLWHAPNAECHWSLEEISVKEHAMSEIFNSPTYSAFIVELYARSGKVISDALDPSQITKSIEDRLASTDACVIFKAIANISKKLIVNT